MSPSVTTVIVCVGGFAVGLASFYINFFRRELWLKFRGQRGNQQYEHRILNDELFVAYCRTAGVFGLIFMIATACGLIQNVPKLF